MATTKHLDPTNVDISIPAMTDQPNASVFSNCVDKEADAINALNDKIDNYGNVTQLGYTDDTGELTLSESILNFKYIFLRLGYYNSGLPSYGSATIPVNAITIQTDNTYRHRIVYYDASAIQYADILFTANNKMLVVAKTTGAYIRVMGVK